jgi:hypothetical protein
VRDSDTAAQRTKVHLVRAADPAAAHELGDQPGAREFVLRSTNGVGGKVVVAGNEGALYDTSLQAHAGTTYRFWVTGPNGEVVHVSRVEAGTGTGLLFDVEGEMTGALISEEPAGPPPPQPTAIVAHGQLG